PRIEVYNDASYSIIEMAGSANSGCANCLSFTNVQNSGALAFLNTVGGTTAERMRIDGSTGNVGIGTTSPAQTLAISGATTITQSVTDTDNTARMHHPISALSPNLPAGGGYFTNLEIGVARNANNLAFLAFTYDADGSASNYVSLGMYGADHLIN